jgi:uncharacterized cupin superfamily protein
MLQGADISIDLNSDGFMVRPGHVMENPVGGEDRIVFTKTAQQTGGEVFGLEVFIRAGAPGTPEMVHPLQDESFEVLSGSLDFRIGGQERRLEAGESLLIPKGTPTSGGTGAMRRPTPSSSLDRRYDRRSYSRTSMGSLTRRGLSLTRCRWPSCSTSTGTRVT